MRFGIRKTLVWGTGRVECRGRSRVRERSTEGGENGAKTTAGVPDGLKQSQEGRRKEDSGTAKAVT